MLELVSDVEGEAGAVAALKRAFSSGFDQQSDQELQSQLENIVNSIADQQWRTIFVSANAVRYTASLIENLSKQLGSYLEQLFREFPCVGMGRATEKAIQDQGWKNESINVDAITTEDLLDLEWARASRLKNQSVLICRGVNGRTLLGDELGIRGARVAYLESYRREQPEITDQEKQVLLECIGQKTDIILSSGETAENFFSFLREVWRSSKKDIFDESLQPFANWRFILPSMRVSNIVSKACEDFNREMLEIKAQGANRTEKYFDAEDCCAVAENASDKSLVEAIARTI